MKSEKIFSFFLSISIFDYHNKNFLEFEVIILINKRIEKIENLEQKIKELQERKQLEEKKLKEQTRRDRTQRLIKVGSATEKILFVEGEDEVRRKLDRILLVLNKTKYFFGIENLEALETFLSESGSENE